MGWAGLVLLASIGWAQDPTTAVDEDLTQARGLLERALNGSPVVKPQAARRFATLGEAARTALVEHLGEQAREDHAGLVELGPDVLAHVGGLLDGPLRERAHAACLDLEFPWRPALIGGLAEAPRPAERAVFDRALGDPLAKARVAAIRGIGALGKAESSAGNLSGLLFDRAGEVRLEAALVLDAWGSQGALAVALQELRRADSFFEVPTGSQARRLAARRLGELLVGTEADGLFGFQARELPSAGPNPAALDRLEAFLRERAGDDWLSDLPPQVIASSLPVEGPLGLELRSCRAGELRLTLTADDRLLVGSGSPAVVELPEGTTAALVKRLADLPERLGDDVFGRPGCDLERFRVAVPGETGVSNIHVLKGPEPIPDLRPGPLDDLASSWLELVPEDGDDPRLAGLRGRLAALLASVGGTP